MLATLAGAANARAGTYTINDCPAAAPGDYTVGPWIPIGENPTNSGANKQTCSTPGDSFGFSGGLSANGTIGEGLRTPSPSITIQHIKLWWEAPHPASGGGWSFAQIDVFYPAWERLFVAETPVVADGAGKDAPTELSPPAGTTQLNVQIYCTTSQNCTYDEDPLQIYGSQVTLSDSTVPTGSVTGGDLAGSGPVSGTSSLTYDAGDEGSGVRRVELLVDGQPASENDYTAECPYENYAACPTSVAGIISWDTDGVSAGAHEVALKVVSAAGDTAIVDDHTVTVGDNSQSSASNPLATVAGPQLCTGSPSNQAKLTARWPSTTRTTLTDRYGARERVIGSLTTPSGQAIAGATVDVCETPTDAEAQTSIVASTRTGPTGMWSITLPRSAPSSSLRFTYPDQGSALPAATATLSLRVHAGLALRIAPRVTSVGRRIYFSGTVHGPIPPGGKQLVLEASSGGEWIQFDTIRTNAQGRYRASYRFKFPGPVTYRFRVVSPLESGFPFLAGTSDGVTVREL